MDTNAPIIVPAPVSEADRIKTIDIVRGVALLGILLMNIPGFGTPWGANDALRRGPHNTADFYTFEAVETFFSGTMRGLFSMLFGAGMILFTMNKRTTPGGVTVAELYYRRLLLLVLFGIINAYIFLWWGDILFFYGFAGMVLYPFRKTAVKWLFVLGFICIAVGMFKTNSWYSEDREARKDYLEVIALEKSGKKLNDDQQQKKAAWLQRENWRPDPERNDSDVAKTRGGYLTVFNFMLPRNSNIETWGMYHGIWDSLCMMFIGMALLGLGFFSNKLSSSTYFLTMLLGYGIGIPIGYLLFMKGEVGAAQYASYVDRYRVSFDLLYDFKRLSLSVGHASLILLIYRSRVVPWLMKALSNVGQMAFSNYLIQSIICTLFFYGYGLGYFNKLSYHQLYYVVAVVWIFQLITSSIWLHYFRFGPFEWVWRSLTYWKKQPMLRREVQAS
jgi:uncharacterized protein